MDPRVAQKLARHAREGVSRPGAPSRTPELARFEAKMAKHLAAQAAPAAEAPVKEESHAQEPKLEPAAPQRHTGKGRGEH